MIHIYLLQTVSTNKREISKQAYDQIRSLASAELGIDKEQINFEYGKYGKPFIKGHKEWQFNISHTDGMIAIATSDFSIGIDIEKIREPDERIARRFFSEKEQEYIRETDSAIRFFEVWTRKEAYIKCIGKGFYQPLNSFDVFEMPEKYRTFHVLQDYIVSVCGDQHISDTQIMTKGI